MEIAEPLMDAILTELLAHAPEFRLIEDYHNDVLPYAALRNPWVAQAITNYREQKRSLSLRGEGSERNITIRVEYDAVAGTIGFKFFPGPSRSYELSDPNFFERFFAEFDKLYSNYFNTDEPR